MKLDLGKRPLLVIFSLAVAIIIAYKLLDNLDFVFAWIGRILAILAPFFVAVLIACVLNMPCEKLENLIRKSKRKFVRTKSRLLSVLFVYIILAGILVLFLSYLIPAVSRSVMDLIAHLPAYWDAIVGYLNNWFDVGDYLGTFGVQDIMAWFSFDNINVYAKGVLNVTSILLSGVLAIIASIYMLLDKESLIAVFHRVIALLIKKNISDKLALYAKRVNEIFSKYIYAQLLDSLIIGILATLLLLVFGVQYAIFLGFMIGISNMIPYFGSIISGAITAVITMVTGGFTQGLWVAVALLTLQQIDGNIIGPRLVGGKLNIRPIWIIIALTIGGGLFGVLGMFLAVPVFAIVKAIIVEYVEIFEGKQVEGEHIVGKP